MGASREDDDVLEGWRRCLRGWHYHDLEQRLERTRLRLNSSRDERLGAVREYDDVARLDVHGGVEKDPEVVAVRVVEAVTEAHGQNRTHEPPPGPLFWRSVGVGPCFTPRTMSEPPPEPEQVFTPRNPPQREMFTRRNEPDMHGNPGLQDSLRDALREPGGQVILYGDTGVGKSTLLKYAAEDEGMQLLSVECVSRRSFDAHIDMAIREITSEREVEIVEAGSREMGAEAGISKVITIRGHVRNQRGQDVRVEILARAPLLALAETLQSADLRLLAFDNFQNVDARERDAFAQAFEVLSDRSSETGDVKMVVLGVADDAASLVGESGSVRRRTTEIGVPRMPDPEILEIFENGFRLLRLRPVGDAHDRLVFYCDGFPYFAHLLGLGVSRLARRRNDDVVDTDAVTAALAQSARDVSASFPGRVNRAFEAGGNVQPRRRILHTLSLSHRREWRSADVLEEYALLYDRPPNPNFLHVALGQLIQSSYGGVLARSGTPMRYVYRFSDPYLRPFLRMTHFTEPIQQRLW
jgi:hypothetical protein